MVDGELGQVKKQTIRIRVAVQKSRESTQLTAAVIERARELAAQMREVAK